MESHASLLELLPALVLLGTVRHAACATLRCCLVLRGGCCVHTWLALRAGQHRGVKGGVGWGATSHEGPNCRSRSLPGSG